MALPSSSPVPIEADTGAGYGSDPVSSGPYAITSVDPATGILLDRNPQWDPATDDVRTALPDQVVVRTGLTGRGAGPGAAGRLGRHRHLRHRRPAGDHGAARRGRGRPAARPGRRRHHRRRPAARPARPTSRRWTTPDCRAAVAAVVDRRGGAGRRSAARATPSARSQLWPRGARRRARGRRPAARPGRRPGARSRRAGSPTGSPPCSPSPTRRPASTVADEVAGRAGRGRHRGRGPAAGRRHLLRHRRRQPRQRRGQRLRHRPGHLDGGLPDARRRSWCRWSTAAASARSATPTTRG